MRILFNNTDVRQYRQLSKQLNADSFAGHARSVQENNLCDLLGGEMFTDMLQFFDIGFTEYVGTWTRDSTTQLTITGADVSIWAGYSLQINDTVFVTVTTAVFGGVDTVLTVTGYDLPATVLTVGFSIETKYTKLLNGELYTNDNSKTFYFYGLRGFLSWHFMSAYLSDGNLKQSDVGNINIVGDLFSGASGSQLREAKSEYMQNAVKEQNKITDYLNSKDDTFTLWETTSAESVTKFDFMII
jgi:hypothetical protein